MKLIYSFIWFFVRRARRATESKVKTPKFLLKMQINYMISLCLMKIIMWSMCKSYYWSLAAGWVSVAIKNIPFLKCLRLAVATTPRITVTFLDYSGLGLLIGGDLKIIIWIWILTVLTTTQSTLHDSLSYQMGKVVMWQTMLAALSDAGSKKSRSGNLPTHTPSAKRQGSTAASTQRRSSSQC